MGSLQNCKKGSSFSQFILLYISSDFFFNFSICLSVLYRRQMIYVFNFV